MIIDKKEIKITKNSINYLNSCISHVKCMIKTSKENNDLVGEMSMKSHLEELYEKVENEKIWLQKLERGENE